MLRRARWPGQRRQLPYDYLVLATGATHSYFGTASGRRLRRA